MANCTWLICSRNGNGNGNGTETRRGYRRHSLPSPFGQFCWHDHEALIRVTTLQSSGGSGRGRGGTTAIPIGFGMVARALLLFSLSLSLSLSPTPFSMSVQIFLPIVFRSLLITSCAAVAAHSGSSGNDHKILFGLLTCHLIILYNIR